MTLSRCLSILSWHAVHIIKHGGVEVSIFSFTISHCFATAALTGSLPRRHGLTGREAPAMRHMPQQHAPLVCLPPSRATCSRRAVTCVFFTQARCGLEGFGANRSSPFPAYVLPYMHQMIPAHHFPAFVCHAASPPLF